MMRMTALWRANSSRQFTWSILRSVVIALRMLCSSSVSAA